MKRLTVQMKSILIVLFSVLCLAFVGTGLYLGSPRTASAAEAKTFDQVTLIMQDGCELRTDQNASGMRFTAVMTEDDFDSIVLNGYSNFSYGICVMPEYYITKYGPFTIDSLFVDNDSHSYQYVWNQSSSGIKHKIIHMETTPVRDSTNKLIYFRGTVGNTGKNANLGVKYTACAYIKATKGGVTYYKLSTPSATNYSMAEMAQRVLDAGTYSGDSGITATLNGYVNRYKSDPSSIVNHSLTQVYCVYGKEDSPVGTFVLKNRYIGATFPRYLNYELDPEHPSPTTVEMYTSDVIEYYYVKPSSSCLAYFGTSDAATQTVQLFYSDIEATFTSTTIGGNAKTVSHTSGTKTASITTSVLSTLEKNKPLTMVISAGTYWDFTCQIFVADKVIRSASDFPIADTSLTYVVANDIDGGTIGSNTMSNKFSGTIYGQGHVIKNVTLGDYGLIGGDFNGTIKDLAVVNAVSKAGNLRNMLSNNVGTTGEGGGQGKLENVYFSGTIGYRALAERIYSNGFVLNNVIINMTKQSADETHNYGSYIVDPEEAHTGTLTTNNVLFVNVKTAGTEASVNFFERLEADWDNAFMNSGFSYSDGILYFNGTKILVDCAENSYTDGLLGYLEINGGDSQTLKLPASVSAINQFKINNYVKSASVSGDTITIAKAQFSSLTKGEELLVSFSDSGVDYIGRTYVADYVISNGDQISTKLVTTGSATIAFSANTSGGKVPTGHDDGHTFSGTIDGRGHTLTNVALKSNDKGGGFIDQNFSGTIKNITISVETASLVDGFICRNIVNGAVVENVLCYAGTCTGYQSAEGARYAFRYFDAGNVSINNLTFGGEVQGFCQADNLVGTVTYTKDLEPYSYDADGNKDTVLGYLAINAGDGTTQTITLPSQVSGSTLSNFKINGQLFTTTYNSGTRVVTFSTGNDSSNSTYLRQAWYTGELPCTFQIDSTYYTGKIYVANYVMRNSSDISSLREKTKYVSTSTWAYNSIVIAQNITGGTLSDADDGDNRFAGIIDGRGHTLTDLSFGGYTLVNFALSGGTIKDLNIVNPLSTNTYNGIIASYVGNGATIENVTVTSTANRYKPYLFLYAAGEVNVKNVAVNLRSATNNETGMIFEQKASAITKNTPTIQLKGGVVTYKDIGNIGTFSRSGASTQTITCGIFVGANIKNFKLNGKTISVTRNATYADKIDITTAAVNTWSSSKTGNISFEFDVETAEGRTHYTGILTVS